MISLVKVQMHLLRHLDATKASAEENATSLQIFFEEEVTCVNRRDAFSSTSG
jgi:hypothetical protein